MTPSTRRLKREPERKPMGNSFQELTDTFLDELRSLNRSPKTINHYQDTFQTFERFLIDTKRAIHTSSMDTSTAQAFAMWLRDTPRREYRGSTTRSIHGVHGNLKDLKTFTRWLHESGYIDNPVKVPMPKLPKQLFPILSSEEIRRVWDTEELTGTGEQKVRNRALVALFFDTGIRLSEAANILLDDLDLENFGLRVNGKGNKQRRVPVSISTVKLINDWMEIRGAEPWPNHHGRHPMSVFLLKAAGIRMLFRRIQIQADLPRFHPHQIRHQAATMMVRKRQPLPIVQAILGHADISTTNAYMSLDDSDIRQAHAEASPFEQIIEFVQISEPPKTRQLKR